MGKFALAWRSFLRVFRDPDFAKRVKEQISPQPTQKVSVPTQALELLALLQEEARLLDFFQEDITNFEDEQIGLAVRDIHARCHRVLQEYFEIIPILEGEEGASTKIPEGFDPHHIKLVGQVSGKPPFQGIIKHHGWKVTASKFPPERSQPSILAPAEVEINISKNC